MAGGPDIHSDDFYEVLGVAKSATPDEIKRAYLALVREHTPERSPEAFKRIRAAYETLSDPAARERYDARPSPEVQALLDEAAKAMNVKNVLRAENLYREVLRLAPQLAWVRNLLGICLLYQKRPQEAIEQFEQILGHPMADASVHGNAAHAYAMARRYDDAERELRVAMRMAGERGFEYGLGLIEMTAERGEVEKADRLADQLIAEAPPGSQASALFYSKRIELAVRLKRRPTIPALLLRMTRDLTTEEQRHHVAGVLGNLAGQMIAQGQYEQAELIARTAGKLAAAEPGFDALERAARLLRLKDRTGVERLLRTHVAFAPGGVVEGMRPVIENNLVAPPRPPKPAARRSRSSWGGGGIVLWLIVSALRTFISDSDRSPAPNPWPPTQVQSRLPLGLDSAASPNETRYTGVLISGTKAGSPVRVRLTLAFPDLSIASNGYASVDPPLSGDGPCFVRASRDSVRLAVYSEADTLTFEGRRVGDTIAGSYRSGGVKPAGWYGQWRVWLVHGEPIPRHLNPW